MHSAISTQERHGFLEWMGWRAKPKEMITPVELYKSFEANPDRVFEYAVQAAEETIHWYEVHARRNRIATSLLRWLAATLTAVAGVLPVLSNLLESQSNVYVDPAWSTVLIAAAALLVALDQLSGCASKYMQFTSAKIRIEKLLKGFVFDALDAKRVRGTDSTGKIQPDQMISICAGFVAKVDEIVLDETGAWVDDFKGALRLQEAQMNTAREKKQEGEASSSV